jgi:hypothetical protein
VTFSSKTILKAVWNLCVLSLLLGCFYFETAGLTLDKGDRLEICVSNECRHFDGRGTLTYVCFLKTHYATHVVNFYSDGWLVGWFVVSRIFFCVGL